MPSRRLSHVGSCLADLERALRGCRDGLTHRSARVTDLAAAFVLDPHGPRIGLFERPVGPAGPPDGASRREA